LRDGWQIWRDCDGLGAWESESIYMRLLARHRYRRRSIYAGRGAAHSCSQSCIAHCQQQCQDRCKTITRIHVSSITQPGRNRPSKLVGVSKTSTSQDNPNPITKNQDLKSKKFWRFKNINFPSGTKLAIKSIGLNGQPRPNPQQFLLLAPTLWYTFFGSIRRPPEENPLHRPHSPNAARFAP
jgi:hypothetical protein